MKWFWRSIAGEIRALRGEYHRDVIGIWYALQINIYPYRWIGNVMYNKCCSGRVFVYRQWREGYLVLPTASDLVVALRALSPKRKFSWKKFDRKINFAQ
jgi:hypothetical protein